MDKPVLRAFIALLALGLVAILGVYFRDLRQGTDAREELRRMSEGRMMLLLETWDASFFDCGDGELSEGSCSPLDVPGVSSVSFPMPEGWLLPFRKALAAATHVRLRHRLSPAEAQWLAKRQGSRLYAPYLVWPSTYQHFREPLVGRSMPATLNLVEPVGSGFGEGELETVLGIRGMTWFGPTDFSPALVQYNRLESYLSLPRLVRFNANVSDLLTFSLPVIFLAFYFIVGQNPVLMALLLLAGSRAIYMFFTHELQARGGLFQVVGAEPLITALLMGDGVVLALMINFAWASVTRLQLGTRVLGTAALALGLLFVGWAHTQADWILFVNSSHRWRDFLGASSGLALLAAGALRSVRRRKRGVSSLLEIIENDLGRGSLGLRVLIFMVAFAALAYANALELRSAAEAFKAFSWGGALFLPLLAAGSLVAVASSNRDGLHYSRQMKARSQSLLETIQGLPRYRTRAEALEYVLLRAQHALQIPVASQAEKVVPSLPPEAAVFEEDAEFLSTLSDALALNLSNIDAMTALKRAHLAASRFVPQEFLRHLGCENLADISHGLNRAENMSILFCDIRGFTTLAESIPAAETFRLLNDHFGRIVPLVKAHRGFIDKFIGDAVMALFPESPLDAIHCAAAIHRSVELAQGAGLRIGVGVHWGHVTIGTVGSNERMETTVVADAVNVASRLESLTKDLDLAVLVSQEALVQVPEEQRAELDVRLVGRVTLRGRQEPTTLFEVFAGESPETRAAKRVSKPDFEAGVNALLDDDSDRAREAFARALRTHAGDRTARTLHGRCRSGE